MTGGIWQTQNKVRPGVYVNFQGEPSITSGAGERGILAVPTTLSWGNDGIIKLEASTFQSDALKLIGYSASDERIRHIRAAIAHVRTLLLYRINGAGGEVATADMDPLTVTAKYKGIRGNDIRVVIQANVDDDTLFDVVTYLENTEVDAQTVATAEELVNNDFVTFAGAGALTESAGTSLTGGTDGISDNGGYADAFSAFEAEEFNVLGVPTEDDDIKQLAVSYVTRLNDEGKKVQAVVYDYDANNEAVINLANSIITSDGLVVEPTSVLWEIAGMQAGANINESLTYAVIPNAVDVHPKLTNSETIQALQNGKLVLTAINERVVIEQDINSFISFSPTKGYMFSKNRVVRLLNSMNNDFVRIFSENFLGKVNNNADGRSLFKAQIISYMSDLQDIGAIQNFNAETDVIVLPGDQIDGVYTEIYVQPLDSMEKFYFKIMVRDTDVSINVGGAA